MALKACSLAAQGLWMRMLCIAAQHDPTGYVSINRVGLDPEGIAKFAGVTCDETRSLIGELDRNGVFTRDRHGTIYNRRMVRDAKKASTARENGKMGGNPTLLKQKGFRSPLNQSSNQHVKPPDKAHDKAGLILNKETTSYTKRKKESSARTFARDARPRSKELNGHDPTSDQFYAKRDTPQWEEWNAWWKRERGTSIPSDPKGGWFVPTEYPPTDEPSK